MKCNEINDMMSLYVDEELEYEEKIYFENHLKECSKCNEEFENYINFINALKNIKEEAPPKGYCERLHKKLEDASHEKKSNKIIWLKYTGVAAALILVFSVASMLNGNLKRFDMNEGIRNQSKAPSENSMNFGSSSPKAEMYDSATDDFDMKEMEYDQYADGETEKHETSLTSLEKRELKVIKTGSVIVETENYDNFINNITETIISYGGYLERNNTQVMHVYDNRELKYGNLTVRIRQGNFEEFVSYIEALGKVKDKNLLETDVSKMYYDQYNKVKNLELQEEHLRLLFDKANTVDEMLQIENELRRIRTEIDSINMNLSDIDDRASMSRIDLEVVEVAKSNVITSRDGLWDRAVKGFINTINNLVRFVENIIIWIVSASPILIPVLIILVVVFIRVRKKLKK